jgi:hypothetical protein
MRKTMTLAVAIAAGAAAMVPAGPANAESPYAYHGRDWSVIKDESSNYWNKLIYVCDNEADGLTVGAQYDLRNHLNDKQEYRWEFDENGSAPPCGSRSYAKGIYWIRAVRTCEEVEGGYWHCGDWVYATPQS